MKNRKLLSGMALVASASMSAVAVVLSTVGPNTLLRVNGELGPNEYYHYAGVAETCETAGIKDYYTNCNGSTVLELPTGGTVKEERTLTDAQVKEIAANSSDERVIAATGHNFEDISGQCAKKSTIESIDMFDVHGTGANGMSTITATENSYEGFGVIYEYKNFYNDGTTAKGITNAFNDYSLTDVDGFEFYIDCMGSEFMFAGDDGTTSTSFEMHPSAGASTPGVIKGTQTAPGTWFIEATGFSFRNMSNGAQVSSFTYTGRNTFNELFHRPSDGWGATQISVSAIKLNKSSRCGATNISKYLITNPTVFADNLGEEACYGLMHAYSSSSKNYIDSNFDISGLTEIKFKINHPDSNNTFILNGNTSSCVGGIYGGSVEDVIIATKSGDDWTVRRQSGKTFFELPSWGNTASYTVEGATKFGQLFDFFTYSSQISLSDFVVKGTIANSRQNITNEAISIYNKYPDGTTSLTDTGEDLLGFGNKYTYSKYYYSTETAKPIDSPFTDYSLAGVKAVEFYIDCNGKEYAFAGDDGTSATSYEMHPSAGAQTPGYIRATQTEAGTWVVHSYGFAFRNMSNGAQVNEFTYTGRNTLKELFHSHLDYGAPTLTLSDIVVVK